jgi:hypothetical protein
MADCWAGLIPVAQYLGARIHDQRVPPRTDPSRRSAISPRAPHSTKFCSRSLGET